MESVRNGLAALSATLRENDWVLVHDAARPGLDDTLIEKLISTTGEHPVGGLLALPVVDTVKRSIGGELGTVSREGLWLAQTPQMFRYKLLREALAFVSDPGRDPQLITDDASAVEALGLSPKLVEGHPRNMKVTLPSDVRIAEMYLATAQPELL
jgi:2-C-methyl-D-erythritol 4-phosphate cytidylyltransferase